MPTNESTFDRLSQINLGSYLKTKNDTLTYLPWTFAHSELLKASPTATYEYIRFPDEHGREVLPFLKTEVGYFVEVAVTIEGNRKNCILPVMDEFNETLWEPTATDINYSLQRCYVKAIAMHGLGLYVYAGEDMPLIPPPERNENQEEGLVEDLIPILIDVRALEGKDKECYYMVDLQFGDEIVEVAIVNEILMKRFDSFGFTAGDPCDIYVRPYGHDVNLSVA